MTRFEIKHKNILMFGVGIAVTLVINQTGIIYQVTNVAGTWGPLGAIVAGMMFASTFSVTTGALLLAALAKTMPPFQLLIFGSLGSVISDLMIFRLTRKSLARDIKENMTKYSHFTGKHQHLRRLLHSRYFGWTLPALGAFIIASPLPDELGVSLMGISRMNIFQFIAISGLSHTMGMITIISARLMV